MRLKSTEDLHKLWHILLIEKNLLISDNKLKKKIHIFNWILPGATVGSM